MNCVSTAYTYIICTADVCIYCILVHEHMYIHMNECTYVGTSWISPPPPSGKKCVTRDRRSRLFPESFQPSSRQFHILLPKNWEDKSIRPSVCLSVFRYSTNISVYKARNCVLCNANESEFTKEGEISLFFRWNLLK